MPLVSHEGVTVDGINPKKFIRQKAQEAGVTAVRTSKTKVAKQPSLTSRPTQTCRAKLPLLSNAFNIFLLLVRRFPLTDFAHPHAYIARLP